MGLLFDIAASIYVVTQASTSSPKSKRIPASHKYRKETQQVQNPIPTTEQTCHSATTSAPSSTAPRA